MVSGAEADVAETVDSDLSARVALQPVVCTNINADKARVSGAIFMEG